MNERLGDLDQQISTGQRAREVIDHPLYQEAFNTLRDELIAEWQESGARDTEGREKLWLMLKLLERTKGHLESLMATGKLAAREKETLLQRLNPWNGGPSLI